MSGPRSLRSTARLALFLVLAGCTESPTDIELDRDDPHTPQDTTTPPPLQERAVVPRGTPVVYIATSSDASVYDHVIGEMIDGSRGAFVQIDPVAREAVVIHTSSSVSYAQSRTTIYTFDDEIYLLDAGETGGWIRRLDNDDLRSGHDIPVPTPRSADSVADRCLVVLGDDLVYKVAYRTASFPGTGWADGPLVRVRNLFAGGGEMQEMMPGIGGDSPAPGGYVTVACQFNMDYADGVWYDVSNRPVNDQLEIFERDPSTGQPTPVGVLANVSQLEASYSVSDIGFDRGRAYVAVLDAGAQEVAVFARTLNGGLWELDGITALSGFTADGIHSLDVDDGHVGLVLRGADGTDAIALYSSDSDTWRTIPIGTSINQLQVLYR